jgi:hypothetical protein
MTDTTNGHAAICRERRLDGRILPDPEFRAVCEHCGAISRSDMVCITMVGGMCGNCRRKAVLERIYDDPGPGGVA